MCDMWQTVHNAVRDADLQPYMFKRIEAEKRTQTMAEIIIDMGSGETCRNDKNIVKRMIDELAAVDTHKHRVYIKWQLFSVIPPTSPSDLLLLEWDVFDYAYRYAAKLGYQTTSSFFDMRSLTFLLDYETPFIKVACRKHLYDMIDETPENKRLVVSIPDPNKMDELRECYKDRDISYLCCVPEYPAVQHYYEQRFWGNLAIGISDHSKDLFLFKEWRPWVYERHMKLEDSTGYDAGAYASTPAELGEIL